MYRENYVRCLLFEALTDLAGDVAIQDSETLEAKVHRYISQASLKIEKEGLTRVIGSFDFTFPELHDELFDDELDLIDEEKAA